MCSRWIVQVFTLSIVALGIAGCSVWNAVLGTEAAPADTSRAGGRAEASPVVADTEVTAGTPRPTPRRLPTLREQMQRIVESQKRIETRLDSLVQQVQALRLEISALKALLKAQPKYTADTAAPSIPTDTSVHQSLVHSEAANAAREHDTATTVLLPDTVIYDDREKSASVAEEAPAVPEDSVLHIVDTHRDSADFQHQGIVFPDSYHEALRALVRKEYAQAQRLFTALLKQTHLHPVVRAYVHYWLGEIAFAQQRYQQAIEEFQRVLEARLIAKMDDALFLSAEAALRMKDIPKAKKFYQQLVTQFPASPYTPRARAMLQVL